MRPFAARDIAQVADLHRRVFRAGEAPNPVRLDDYGRYFAEVFPPGGAGAPAVQSLVYERSGVVLGFLGIRPRRMTFNGRTVVMAVCSQFAVDPAGRGQAGLRLLKECFDGPQSLTISDEAGDNTREIWEWCGGEIVPALSLRWIRPLRPAGLVLAVLARQKSMAFRSRTTTAAARLVDAVIARLGPDRLRVPRPRGSREEIDEATLAACLSEIASRRALLPQYDAHSAAWAIRRAGQRPGHAPVRTMAVRTGPQGIAGWFLYCLSDDGIAEVLQVAARPGAMAGVLDHLFEDAAQQRAVAVSGRVEPQLLAALSGTRILFCRGSHWTLLHSANPELRHAVHRGDAFLSRLEGEWCLRYP